MKYPLTIFIAVLAIFVPMFAKAATLTLTQNPVHVGKGDTLEITITVDTGVSVNSFAGTLTYPQNLLEVTGVNDGNSIVSLWLTHPSTDSLAFAGFTPGGFTGAGGKLFSVFFKAKAPGSASIALTNVEVLRNDGEGTKELTTVRPLSIAIGSVALGEYHEVADTVPPEPFTPYAGTDPDLYGGKHYIAFSTVDKASGVDHYEVTEYRLPFFFHTYETTNSPYLVLDQYLTSDVAVKAVDRAGNERIGVYPRQHLLRPHEWLILVCILVLGLVLRWYIRK